MEGNVKLRLEGTPQECQQVVPLLGEVLDVVSISPPYPNRGQSRLVRVYLEIRLDAERTRQPAGPRRTRATLRQVAAELPPPA